MADHVAASIQEPKLSRKRKLGKNKKKSWRAIDITETEEFLEDERFQLRTTGIIADKPDDQLFVVDKTQADLSRTGQSRKPKPLKCYSILVNTSKIACPRVEDPGIVGKKPASVLAAEERKATSFTRQQAIRQRKQALQEKAKKMEKKKSLPTFSQDLWADEKNHDADEYFLEVTKKLRVRPPVKPSPSRKAAVEPPHPGASYNPSYDDHQDLLLQAHLVEMKKERAERKIYNATDAKFPSLDEAPTQATWLAEMSGGLFAEEEGDDEGGAGEVTGDDDRISVNPPTSLEQRKTKKERRKAKEEREARKSLRKEKEEKLRENMVFRLPSLRSQLNKESREMAKNAKLKALKREEKRAGTKKLGKEKFVDPDMELKLSDELVGNLRHLKPEGHLLQDRYKSLQKRNIIEPRKRARKTKVKKKTFEKKSHKNVV